MCLSAAAVAADGITVSTNEVRILTFPAPQEDGVCGNPTIADVTVIDSTHVFVLGKSFGTTKSRRPGRGRPSERR
jgi:Flp pilus assembly secretin CpaC